MIQSADSKPTLEELQFLMVFNRQEPLRIMESVASYRYWKHLAIFLGFDWARIGIIEENSRYQPEGATLEMFSRWLQGDHDLKPVTWKSVIEGLKVVRLMNIANILSNMVL